MRRYGVGASGGLSRILDRTPECIDIHASGVRLRAAGWDRVYERARLHRLRRLLSQHKDVGPVERGAPGNTLGFRTIIGQEVPPPAQNPVAKKRGNPARFRLEIAAALPLVRLDPSSEFRNVGNMR